MRITESMRYDTAILNQSRASERLANAGAAASSGNRVNAPSDDPVAYYAKVQDDARIAALEARSQAATRTAGDLDLAESTLDAAQNLLVRAREIAVQTASDPADAASRANAAKEVDSLRQQMIALANTKGTSGYLFGGTKSDAAPFDSAGAFSGNDGVTHVEIGNGVLAASNTSGARAFTAVGGTDVLSVLSALSNALTTDDGASVRASLGQIDDASRQLIAGRIDAGTSATRLRSVADVMATALVAVTAARASEIEADTPAAYSELTAAQAAYDRSVAVTRDILSALSAQK